MIQPPPYPPPSSPQWWWSVVSLWCAPSPLWCGCGSGCVITQGCFSIHRRTIDIDIGIIIILQYYENYCILQEFQCISSAAVVALTVSGPDRWISSICRPLKSFLWESLKNIRKMKVSGCRISDHTMGGGGYGGTGDWIIYINVYVYISIRRPLVGHQAVEARSS